MNKYGICWICERLELETCRIQNRTICFDCYREHCYWDTLKGEPRIKKSCLSSILQGGFL